MSNSPEEESWKDGCSVARSLDVGAMVSSGRSLRDEVSGSGGPMVGIVAAGRAGIGAVQIAGRWPGRTTHVC
jgi:hypothetical protein